MPNPRAIKNVKSFQTPLYNCVNTQDWITLTQYTIPELQTHWTEVWSENNLMRGETSTLTRKGDWWTTYLTKTQISRKNWTLGENALWFRVLMESMRQTLASCQERRDIIPYAQEYDWDETKLNEINQAAASDGVKMQKYSVLRGICRTHGDVYPAEEPPLRLDLSVIHNQGCYRDDTSLKTDPRTLVYKLRVSKTDWVTLKVKIPLYCQPVSLTDPKTYSKPLIRVARNGAVMLQVTYEAATGNPADYDLTPNRVYAIDLGVVKAYAGSWLDVKSGEWGTGFLPTRETERVNDALSVTCRILRNIVVRQDALGKIIKGQASPDPVDVAAWARRDTERGLLSAKVTELKDIVAWLISRDVVAQALSLGCGVIKMEDLGFVQEAYGSKWAHGLVKDRLTERARAFGITVEVVPAGDSSHLDPFTMERVEPRADRSVVTSGGMMDRDDLASLNLASRKSSKACRALKRKTGSPVKVGGQSQVRRDRRKMGPTPRRARPVRRRRVLLGLINCDPMVVCHGVAWGSRLVSVAVDYGSASPHGGVIARTDCSGQPEHGFVNTG